jgi:hypothetical protein
VPLNYALEANPHPNPKSEKNDEIAPYGAAIAAPRIAPFALGLTMTSSSKPNFVFARCCAFSGLRLTRSFHLDRCFEPL